MCLKKPVLHEYLDWNINAWKVFEQTQKGLQFVFRTSVHADNRVIIPGERIRAYPGPSLSYSYQMGFHAFLTEESAERYIEVPWVNASRKNRSLVAKKINIHVHTIGHDETSLHDLTVVGDSMEIIDE